MSYTDAMTHIHEAGAALAAARVAEAESFLSKRWGTSAGTTDNQAKAMAIVETGSAVDICEAEWEAAKAYLQVAVAEIAREKV